MAIQFILEIVMHLFQCALYVAFGLDITSFLEIILFELVIEIIKNCTLKIQTIPRSELETPVSSQSISVIKVNNGIPVVRSIAVHRF
ncbi:hypothetical protein TNIN_395601 [Trichonephila inaurata madagascariensis]|uniref:Uncharacterized protein n=1 Tax=Trichonephila inaurata madagascariensis TaxID=2747483 RepID=A0A8X6WWD8_9ARAC|nr:hypothetical protein TNIN_395601 [Trichonephila inaurata madagascariensis]